MPPPAGKPGPRLSSNGYDIHDSAGLYNVAGGVSIQPDDKIVVASTVGTGNAMLLRYTTSGVLDTSFDADGVVETNIATGTTDTWVGIGHTWDGKIVVSGYGGGGEGGGDFAAGRYFSGVGLDQRLYVQQDANWNVTSVSNALGSTVERYRYTPYGKRTVLNDEFTVNADERTPRRWRCAGFKTGLAGIYSGTFSVISSIERVWLINCALNSATRAVRGSAAGRAPVGGGRSLPN